MIMDAKEMIKEAQAKGACGLAEGVEDLESLADLFFSPQGLEFCSTRNFPDLGAFLALDEADLSKYQVYVSKGVIRAQNQPRTALIGNTHGVLTFIGSKNLNTVVLMHGASASIKASRYAVVKIVKIGNGNKVSLDIDNSVQIL